MTGPPINYLVTLVAAKMQVPATGGHGRCPEYNQKARINLSMAMQVKLEKITAEINRRGLVQVRVMDVAALILELALEGEQVSSAETQS